MQGPSSLSYSSTKSFQECPAMWKARYVDRIKGAMTDALSFGQNFDRLVARELGLSAADWDGKELCDDDITPELQAAISVYKKFPHNWITTSLGKNPRTQVKVKASPERWREVADRYGSESEITKPVIGFIDLMRDMDGLRTEVLDLKTSGRFEFRPEWNTQILLYSALVDASAAHIHLVSRTKKPRCGGHTLLLDHNHELVRQALDSYAYFHNQQEIVLRSERYENLPRTPGIQCMFCPIGETCATRMSLK